MLKVLSFSAFFFVVSAFILSTDASAKEVQGGATTIVESISIAKNEPQFTGVTLKQSLALAKQEKARVQGANVEKTDSRVLGVYAMNKAQGEMVDLTKIELRNRLDAYASSLIEKIEKYYSSTDGEVLGTSRANINTSSIAGSIEFAKTAKANQPDTSTIAGSIVAARVR